MNTILWTLRAALFFLCGAATIDLALILGLLALWLGWEAANAPDDPEDTPPN